jgi:hypothetical protein
MDVITEVGCVKHDVQGSNEEKIQFLQQHVESDFANAKKFELPDNFTTKSDGVTRKAIDYGIYKDLYNEGHGLLIFEKAFQHFYASANPLIVVTPVKNGQIYFEGREEFRKTDKTPPTFVHVDKPKAWYTDYIDNEGFHFDRLINDDFFAAIKILYNAQHYVSAMKLLMICLDTVAYLDFGDVPKNFENWLNTYADLSHIGILSEELWEFRNSILHMTNLDSRKIKAGHVRRVMFYVSGPSLRYVKESDEGKYFRFKDLIDVVASGINEWAKSYDIYKDKFETLLNRYDRIISDKRMTYIKFDQL